tara:strand:- start:77 stop:544 length:468 start_codon:yes stop_codon:yes gene_type:complete
MSIIKKIRSKIDKARKKYIPTFGEQHSKAKAEGKKTFRSTRDDTKKGNLEYSTETKAEKTKAQKRLSNRERGSTGDTSKQLTSRGAKFKLAKKMGKKTFTHNGKTYTTLLKGEKKKKLLQMPELSGKTSTKIKKIIRSPKRGGGMALRGYGKAMR